MLNNQTYYQPSSLNKRTVRVPMAVIGALILMGVLLVIGVSVSAPSAAEMRMQGWVNTLNQDALTVERQEAMSQLENAGDAAVPYLESALHSNNWIMRRNAADMLGFIASPVASSALQDILANETVPAVRENAAWALGEAKTFMTVNALQRAAVTDTSPLVRAAASDSLAWTHTRIALAAGINDQKLYAYAVAPADANTIYATTDRNIAVSHDAGATWTTLSNALPSLANSLAVSPSNSQVVYAGVDSLGMYKSVDGGKSWTAINSGLDVMPGAQFVVSAITVDPNNADHLAIATGVRLGTSNVQYEPLDLMQTTNGGVTWTSAGRTTRTDPVDELAFKGQSLLALAGSQVIQFPLD